MISCGIKMGLKDYKSKINSGADFFEILYDGNYLPTEYSQMVKSIKILKRPFFFHLSTSFNKNADIYLLNCASGDPFIRNHSRMILSQEIKELSKYHPQGFIVHTPTTFDFSRNQKILGKKITRQNCLASFKWLGDFTGNIYVENSPEAININDQNYPTEPLTCLESKKYGLNPLLDTGHFYTTCLLHKKKFSSETHLDFLKKFSYFHISTLNKKDIHDTHGDIFLSSNNNFPSKKQLKDIISKIQKNERETGCHYYLVCEPSDGTDVHLANFAELVKLVNGK